MGRMLYRLLLLSLVAAQAACSGIIVRSDWDREIRFDAFQRYHWVEPPRREDANPFADNDLLRKRVRGAVDAALADRGFRAVDTPEEADFLVTWDLTLEDRLRVDGSTVGGGGYWRGGYWGASAATSVQSYQESTLLIDFLDSKTRKLVWRGWANRVVRTRDRNRDEKRLRAGVRKIIEAFPPT